MNASFNYYWRLAATGGCFAAFGIGGLVLTILVFPLLAVLSPAHARARHARWVIYKAFGTFLKLMQFVGLLRLEVIGAERLRASRNTLVLANHPTLIDVVALLSLMPEASCVVKQALWKNPFLGGAVRAANYVSNAAPENLITDCAYDLAAGNRLIVFPEGTRTEPGKPLHFLRGAAYIALKSKMQILPVLITCVPSTLTKAEKWYHIPPKRMHLRIKVLEPLDALRWIDDGQADAIAARKLTQALEAYFTEELEKDARR